MQVNHILDMTGILWSYLQNVLLMLHVYTRNIDGIYCLQDCLATIPPYPYYIGDRGAGYDVVASIADPDSMWIVRPQLFFTCTVR
jgi:hypothetical protein